MNWPHIVTAIGTVIMAVAIISTAVLAVITIYDYIFEDDLDIEFNDYFILCQRYEPYLVDVGSEYSLFDTLTLNFSLINNNPLKNFLIGNLYLFISSEPGGAEKFIKNFNKNEKTNIIDLTNYEDSFIYQAQYIFEYFDWQDVVYYDNNGAFQIFGLPSNSVNVSNIEFYPIGWTEDDVNRNTLYLTNEKYYDVKECETYYAEFYIVLFQGYAVEDDFKIWEIEEVFNKNKHIIGIPCTHLEDIIITVEEINEIEERRMIIIENYLKTKQELRDELLSLTDQNQIKSKLEEILSLEMEDFYSIVKGNMY